MPISSWERPGSLCGPAIPIHRLASDADSLALDREPAFYGSPEGVPAGELFEREDAEEALEKASRAMSIAREALTRYRQGERE